MTILDVKPGDYFIFRGKTLIKGTPGKNKEVRIIDPTSGDIMTVPKNGEVIPVFRKKTEEEYVDKNSLLKFLFEKVEHLTYEELEGATTMIYFVSQFSTTDVVRRDDLEEKKDALHKLVEIEMRKENVTSDAYMRIFNTLSSF